LTRRRLDEKWWALLEGGYRGVYNEERHIAHTLGASPLAH